MRGTIKKKITAIATSGRHKAIETEWNKYRQFFANKRVLFFDGLETEADRQLYQRQRELVQKIPADRLFEQLIETHEKLNAIRQTAARKTGEFEALRTSLWPLREKLQMEFENKPLDEKRMLLEFEEICNNNQEITAFKKKYGFK